MKHILFLILLYITTVSCSQKKELLSFVHNLHPIDTTKVLNKEQLKTWHLKDIEDDTIPGISLHKAYDKLLKNKKYSKVIVAVIDTEVKKDHEALKNHIWINKDEIPNNGIDDDDNGYIDDINGWNFIGNKKGESIFWANFEATRIVRDYKPLFKNVDTSKIEVKTNPKYINYIRAKEYISKEEMKAKKILKAAPSIVEKYKNVFKVLEPYLKREKYTKPLLDSLEKIHPELKEPIKSAKLALKYNITREILQKDIERFEAHLNYCLNFEYSERTITGDDPNNIYNTDYGNNLISKNTQWSHHATYISKIVLGDKNEINFMPLVITAFGDFSKCGGDEHDKDIALAIRYAVDNGAKVINMSYGKEFSLHLDWVLEAIKYAEEHNVIIISSAGNESYNLDDPNILDYPNDTNENRVEVANNFINVGASSYGLNKNLRSNFSNYGKKEVDIFAPGSEIYTTTVFKEKYDFIDGTSMSAPIVSKIAALLFSYYPNLTASEVKHIIMDSGVEYTIPVKVPTKEDKERTIPFNELSKSGKIVNAYNALLMAEEISRKK